MDRHSGIGTLNEKSLHAAIKKWYAQPGDLCEVKTNGYVVDIVRGDLLVEIQTGGFSSIKRKIAVLCEKHRVRLVYPVAESKWIVKLPQRPSGRRSRRKSPRRGTALDVFYELVSFPEYLVWPEFSVEVLLTQEEEIRDFGRRGRRRRRRWSVVDRHLLQVSGSRLFASPEDVACLIPSALPSPFTTSDLASRLRRPKRLAQKMAYCLRRMDLIAPCGKRRNSILYTRSSDSFGPPDGREAKAV